MGILDDRLLYNACRATVHETVKAKFKVYALDWRKQDAEFIASACALIEKRQPILKNYERGWATLEMMRTYMKGKRAYKALLTKLETEHYAAAAKLFGGINLSAARRPVPVVLDSDEENGSETATLRKGGASRKKVVVEVEDTDSEEEEEDTDSEEEEEVVEKRKGNGTKRKRAEEEEEEEEEEEVVEKQKGKGIRRKRA
ncbi:hypothetical protein BJ165DRAFT_1408439 [Panaeolus papilionaceus]|nr:hypothetical protein BJ165DRAFT_1408439 [Panaeolus papilionaceus]